MGSKNKIRYGKQMNSSINGKDVVKIVGGIAAAGLAILKLIEKITGGEADVGRNNIHGNRR